MCWTYCEGCTTLYGHHGSMKAITCQHPAEKQTACGKCLGYPNREHAEWCREGPMQDRIAALEAKVARLTAVATTGAIYRAAYEAYLARQQRYEKWTSRTRHLRALLDRAEQEQDEALAACLAAGDLLGEGE